MPAKARKSTLLLAAVASIALLTGCGEDRSNLVPADASAQIDADLVLVGKLVRDGNCFEALSATQEVFDEVEALGNNVDGTLRRNLLDGVTQLQIKVQDNCEEADSVVPAEPVEPVTPPADTPEPAPEENATGTTGSTGATGTTEPTTQPQPEPAPEPAPTPTPPTTPPDNGSGGVGPQTGGVVAPPTGGA
jgi:hypothetical protein